MATSVLGLKTFTASDPVDYNEINDNYNKIDNGVKTALQGRAAHNLLDNSDFTKPVNQRGATSYSAAGYTIDRWYFYNPNGDGTVTINNGYISLTGGSGAVSLSCRLPKGFLDANKKYTSMICDNLGNITPTSLIFYDSFYSFEVSAGAGETKNIALAALYEGSYTADNLPAYQPKGYAAELAECLMFHREDVVVPVSKIKDAIFLIGTVIQMRDMGGLKPTITLKKFTRPGVIDVTSFNESDKIDIENLGGGRYLLMNANLVSCMDYASGYLIFSVNADI